MEVVYLGLIPQAKDRTDRWTAPPPHPTVLPPAGTTAKVCQAAPAGFRAEQLIPSVKAWGKKTTKQKKSIFYSAWKRPSAELFFLSKLGEMSLFCKSKKTTTKN